MILPLDVGLLTSTRKDFGRSDWNLLLFFSTQTNGLDSFICGALYDFAFAGDTNYAQIFHHRLFESTTPQGETRRHDIVALNICRGREHGIPSYNAYREFCGLKRANSFQDFADVMTGESVQKLQMIYK